METEIDWNLCIICIGGGGGDGSIGLLARILGGDLIAI